MNKDIFLVLVSFCIYLLFVLWVGITSSKKKSSTSEDYFLGSRKFGPYTTALSAEASDMSAWMLMGLPGLAFLTGYQEAFWTGIGLIIGTYLNWLFIARRLRVFSHKTSSLTIPAVFDARFKDEKHILKTISALITFFFFIIYVASAFISCGKLFSSIFPISYYSALLLTSFVIIAYTFAGGYRAVVITDFIQGLLMFVAVVITFLTAVVVIGGKSELLGAFSSNKDLVLNPFTDNSYSVVSKISCLAWGLGYFGMPHILVRFMGIKNESDIRLSRRVAMVWLLIALFASTALGLVGRILLDSRNISLSDSETVFIVLCKNLFPPLLAGVFLCGILASSMSTADSQLLVAASAFSEDIYKSKIKKNATSTEIFSLGRITVVIVALIALFLSLDEKSSIFKVVAYAWAGFGSSFAPVIIFSLYWKKATARGAAASLISGALTVVIWKNFLHGGIFDIYELLPGFIISSICMILFSLSDKKENIKACEDIYLSNFNK